VNCFPWRRMLLAGALCALAPLTAEVGAQGGPPAGAAAGRGDRGLRAGGGGAPTEDPRRVLLERRFQERLLTIVKQRLALSDDQAMRLREVASRTEDERRALRRDELTARFAMRQELLAGDRANETKVAELLEQMPRLERRRLDLMEQEQRELRRFLSPLQRARYFGLQDELRRGMQEVQQNRLAAPDSDSPPRAGNARPLAPRRLKRPPPF
jgi:protein CpxP